MHAAVVNNIEDAELEGADGGGEPEEVKPLNWLKKGGDCAHMVSGLLHDLNLTSWFQQVRRTRGSQLCDLPEMQFSIFLVLEVWVLGWSLGGSTDMSWRREMRKARLLVGEVQTRLSSR